MNMDSNVILNNILKSLKFPEKVKIKDYNAASKKIMEIIKGGMNSLQIITDFDYTVTTSYPYILSRSPLMSASFKKRLIDRVKRWHMLEMGKSTFEEKSKQLFEICEDNQTDLLKYKLTRSTLEDIVKSADLPNLREGTEAVFGLLNESNVPVLIFSAGNAYFIEAILKKHGVSFPNLHLIANFMEFDNNPNVNEQTIIGFSKPLFHSFNKHVSAIIQADYFKDLSHRNNVILLGDSLGDAKMCEGVESIDVELKIGFLNHHADERLETYLDAYDIVLVEDMTMDFLNALAKNIVQDVHRKNT